MTTATAPRAQSSDLIGQIIYAVRSMGVAPIPRNYQLFYEAYIGSNPDLTRDLAALGSRATQEELDALSHRYLGTGQVAVIEDAHTKLLGELDALLKLLRQEQSLARKLRQAAWRNRPADQLQEQFLQRPLDQRAGAAERGDRQHDGAWRKDRRRRRPAFAGNGSGPPGTRRIQADRQYRSLTRIANRRAFDERLAATYDNSAVLPVTALVLADIDNFKKINDTYGHPVGDKILATVASVIRSNVRKDVFVARSGGEEFAIIVEGNTPEEVMIICERVRRALETRIFRNSRSGIDYGPVTISLGFAMGSQASDPGELYANADTALYTAKNTGRNRSIFFEDGMKKDYVGKSWLIYRK